MPPVSTISKDLPFQVALPYMRSRVMPGSSVTMDRRCPMIRLNRVDFPTFGRPTMAIKGKGEFMKGSGQDFGFGIVDFRLRIPNLKNQVNKNQQIGNPESGIRNPILVPL